MEESQQRRSPSPPPPPPSSDSQLQISDQINQEPPKSAEKEEEEEAVPFENVQEMEEGLNVADENRIDEEEDVDDEEEGAESGGSAVSTEDLRDKIVRQVEYYFSDENLPNDQFLLKFVRKDKRGFVPIAVIASFRRMKKLVQDQSLIEAALRTSSKLVLSKDGRRVRRLHPLPVAEIKDSKPCTVIVENLPDDRSTENLQKIFACVGKVVNIMIQDPQSTEESKMTKKTEMAFSSKLHALIEYETVDDAASAVATLNDKENWRTGMRVELLVRRMQKYGLIRGHKETFPEKKNYNQSPEIASDGQKLKSDDHNDEKAEKEEEDPFAGGKGGRKNRYKSRGRGQPNGSRQGHGQVASGSNNGASKPIPGPKMPDGTRGFTMGRGKPCVSEPN